MLSLSFFIYLFVPSFGCLLAYLFVSFCLFLCSFECLFISLIIYLVLLSRLSLKPWQQWHNHINQFALYSPDDPAIDRLVSDLATLKIVGLRTMEDYGTQIKMVFKLSDGSEALFKPMRYAHQQECFGLNSFDTVDSVMNISPELAA